LRQIFFVFFYVREREFEFTQENVSKIDSKRGTANLWFDALRARLRFHAAGVMPHGGYFGGFFGLLQEFFGGRFALA